jgi:hypothetical protein
MKTEATWGGMFVRWVFAVVLVLLTFNPSGWSYHHWAMKNLKEFSPAKAVVGALLLCLWVLFLRAAFQSLGKLGVALSVVVVASFVWLFADWGWLDPARPGVLGWIALVALGLVLGFGLSWSILRRRLTGQVDVEAPERA